MESPVILRTGAPYMGNPKTEYEYHRRPQERPRALPAANGADKVYNLTMGPNNHNAIRVPSDYQEQPQITIESPEIAEARQ